MHRSSKFLKEITGNQKSVIQRFSSSLAAKKCVPCEGGVDPLTNTKTKELLKQVPQWSLSEDGKKISRTWIMKNFPSGIEFFRDICKIAETEGHHPDLHLTSYRNVTIELWTHALGGLSENDFIVAAKIDQLKPQIKDW